MIERAPEPVVRWLRLTALANHWRVAPWIELDDLVQDGLYYYCKVHAHYPEVRDPAHRMALLKTAFHNHLHSLAQKRSGLNETDLGADKDAKLAERLVDSGEQEVAVLLRQAPLVVRGVLMLGDKLRTTRRLTNAYVCQRLAEIGILVDPRKHNVMTEVRQFFIDQVYERTISC